MILCWTSPVVGCVRPDVDKIGNDGDGSLKH